MQDHPFHRTIGRLVDRLAFSLGTDYWKAPECKGPKRVPLLHCERSECVQFCLVDILIILPDKVVVIEIEESKVKPLHLFGKFFASVHSTHHKDTDISKLPLLFIQVLDTSRINLEEGQKEKQWDRIKKILQGQADNWPGRSVQYELLWGKPVEFEAGSKVAEELLRVIRRFLEIEIGNERRR